MCYCTRSWKNRCDDVWRLNKITGTLFKLCIKFSTTICKLMFKFCWGHSLCPCCVMFLLFCLSPCPKASQPMSRFVSAWYLLSVLLNLLQRSVQITERSDRSSWGADVCVTFLMWPSSRWWCVPLLRQKGLKVQLCIGWGDWAIILTLSIFR